MRVAYFILGMHRSGTSAIASTFDNLGVNFGESLLPPSEDNPKGYFENKAVQAFNETLLVDNGFGWDDLFFDIDGIERDHYKTLVARAKKIIEREFGLFQTFGIKDPRLCLLFPIWLDACRQLEIKVKVVLAHRNPIAVAQSLKARNEMSLQSGLALWAEYMSKAELYSRDLERHLVDFDKLISDFETTSKAILRFIGNEKISTAPSKGVIDSKLRHFTRSEELLLGVPSFVEKISQEFEQGTLSHSVLDKTVAEFAQLKHFFFNQHKTSLFLQFFEERKKYKALKDDYFNKLQHAEALNAKNEQKLTKIDDAVSKRDQRIRDEVECKKELEAKAAQLQHKLNVAELESARNKLHHAQIEQKNQTLIETQQELVAINEKLIDDIQRQDIEVQQQASTIESLKGELKQKTAKVGNLESNLVAAAENYQRKENKLIESFQQDKQIIKEQLKKAHQEDLVAVSQNVDQRISDWIEVLLSPLSTLIDDYADKSATQSLIKTKVSTLLFSRKLEYASKRFLQRFDTAKLIPISFIANFDEDGYLKANDDIAVAVESGELSCALEHFLLFGCIEAFNGQRRIHPKGRIFSRKRGDNEEKKIAFRAFLANYYSPFAKLTDTPSGKKGEATQSFAINTSKVESTLPVATITKQADETFIRPAPNYIAELSATPSVDIILPVYNALDDVKACIDSMYANQSIPFNLIVIDDCSDQETEQWLLQEQKIRGFNLSRNDENLRFTKTVNRGFAKSTGDFVVLLNSDTIVTTYWLEKILYCFQSDPQTGIVGPLSNAASWQTVPVREDKVNGGWMVNQIPAGYSIELMGHLVETVSTRQYPSVPSVNGFCYVISREVINAIGTLDEEYFPTGYGEEDDFSIRARHAGFSIRVADDTYVYHAKSKSYTKEVRKVLTVGGRKSLDKKHGKEEIENLIAAWKAEQYLPEIGQAIESFMHVSSGNKKVVYTAIFGNYDHLKTPEYINPDWDYVCFTDNREVKSDIFTVKHVSPLFANTTKNARMIKLLSHLFLINYDYSLWVDGSVKIRGRNINEVIDNNLAENYISLHRHVIRGCVYEEEEACSLAKKDGAEILATQVQYYREQGMPAEFGLFETAEIARDHREPAVQQLNANWWQQLNTFSIRDQVSLPYVFWKNGYQNHFMEGNQWLDAYFHMYKHNSEAAQQLASIEIVIPIQNQTTKVSDLIDEVFAKNHYPAFTVTVLLSTDHSANDVDLTTLENKYGTHLTIRKLQQGLSLSGLNDAIKRGQSELCCLLSEQVKLFNSDWLTMLVDGMKQDELASIAGPTILSEDFDFIASGVRVKRKQGEVVEIFNSRKLGGTGTVPAVHQDCVLFSRKQFNKLKGFDTQFDDLRSAVIELCNRNNHDGKNSRLVLNSEVIVKEDNESLADIELLKKSLSN